MRQLSLFTVNMATLEAKWFSSLKESEQVLGFAPTLEDMATNGEAEGIGYWFIKDDDTAVDRVRGKLPGPTKEGLWFIETDDAESNEKLLHFTNESHHDGDYWLNVEILPPTWRKEAVVK